MLYREIEFNEIVGYVRRNLFGGILSLVIGVELAIAASLILPKWYKSDTILDIQSRYFRNPLVSELVSEVTDPTELKSQRSALIQRALDRDFLNYLGEKFNLFESIAGTKKRRIERKELLKNIEYHSLGATSFRLSTKAKSSEQALRLTEEVLEQVMHVIVSARYGSLLRAQIAIQSQVEFLAQTLQDLGLVREVGQLKRRLSVVSDQIKRLSARFTKEHPELIALKKESREISEQIERGALKSTIFDQDIQARAFTHSQSEAPIQDIYHELLKKLSHLEIVLRMEESRDDGGVMYLSILKEPSEPTEPFSPDLIRLIFLGVLGGSGLAILQGLYFERKRALEVCTEKFLEDFGVAKLGQLSALPSTQRLALISGSNPRALPPPDQEEA
ncbi:hypothetical protein EBR25_09955 [bacterium]|nr:hypothetical protein [bacterium]